MLPAAWGRMRNSRVKVAATGHGGCSNKVGLGMVMEANGDAG